MHRRSRRAAVSAALASAALVLAAVPTAQAEGQVTLLHTTMTGAEEVEPGDDDGRGAFAALIKGDTLCYVLVATRIETATAAHIHVAPVGVGGPVVVPLDPPNNVTTDCVSVDAELLAAIVASPEDYYVNVHNRGFPDGAIRGQLG